MSSVLKCLMSTDSMCFGCIFLTMLLEPQRNERQESVAKNPSSIISWLDGKRGRLGFNGRGF